MEYFCAKSKSRKLRSHKHDCNYSKLLAKRSKNFGLLTEALKVYMLKIREVGEGHPKFTCSRGLERGFQNLHAQLGGGHPNKAYLCGSTKQNKVKKIYFRFPLGASLGRVPAGSPTQSPMELHHCVFLVRRVSLSTRR